MTNLTNKETIVLLAFKTYTGAESTKSDLGISWTDARDLSLETGLDIKTVKGVLGSLVNKGLVLTDEGMGGVMIQCLTEAGVDALFAARAQLPAPVDTAADGAVLVTATETVTEEDMAAFPEPEAVDEPIAPVDEVDAEVAAFVAALIKAGADEAVAKSMGNPFPGIICATLRSFAATWTGSRKTFIVTASLAGFNKYTAATQWQTGRKGA